MSFWISVRRPEDEDKIPPLDAIPYVDVVDASEWWAAFNKWEEQAKEAYLYWEPLGAGGTVYRFWSTIASQLGLPMLTSLYQHGLHLETLNQLAQLEHELDDLQTYWDTHELRDEPTSGIYGQEKEHLRERMGYLREAVQIARETGARLTVS
jgi:hypothetical protein